MVICLTNRGLDGIRFDKPGYMGYKVWRIWGLGILDIVVWDYGRPIYSA